MYLVIAGDNYYPGWFADDWDSLHHTEDAALDELMACMADRDSDWGCVVFLDSITCQWQTKYTMIVGWGPNPDATDSNNPRWNWGLLERYEDS